jgi:hypothetical protein
MQPRALVLLALVVTAMRAPAAQSSGDLRAFTALRATHLGALTPLMTPAMISRRLNGAQLGIRYGLLDEQGIRTNAVAASGIFAAGLQSSVTVTAGVTDGDCTDCSPAMLLGIGGDMRIYETGTALGSGSGFSLAVGGDLGYAQLKPGDDHAISLGISAPATWSPNRLAEGVRFAAYFTPVFGIGQTSNACPSGCDKSGTRWVLGGGVGVWNPMTNVSASLGINQVILSGAKPVFGVNVVLGGR